MCIERSTMNVKYSQAVNTQFRLGYRTQEAYVPVITVLKLLLCETAASFHAAKRNRDLSGFDAINQA